MPGPKLSSPVRLPERSAYGLQHAAPPAQVGVVSTVAPHPPATGQPGASGQGRRAGTPVRWSATGGFLGLLLFATSLGPSLLPRSSVTQGVVSGLAFITGYGIGALLGWGTRAIGRLPGWPTSVRRLVALGFLVALAGVVALTPSRLAAVDEQAREVEGSGPLEPWVVLGVALATAVVLLLLGRMLRGLARGLARPWRRVVRYPAVVPDVLGALTAGVLVVGVLAGCYALMLGLFTEIDRDTTGQAPPASPLRSGGPGSYVPWDTLGREGRTFVAGGPTATQIAQFRGSADAQEPIRVFVGLDSAGDAQARAALAVQELERTGAFDRQAVVVITTTGNGFVDPVSADALEYVTDGDVASAAIQYSVLPSWLSFLVDQAASGDAGTALYEAVAQRIAALPAAQRPALYVYGESLGAFGAQVPFAGLTPEQVVERVDGALFVGPPAASALRAEWMSEATAGPAWEPVVGDGTVAVFAATAASVPVDDPGWGPRRVLYLQNATDPVVWFDPDLLGTAPAWLDDPRGPGVPAAMEWWPLETFEQVAMDLPPAGGMPAGYGHAYGDSVPVGWVALVRPPGWTAEDTARLVATVG